MLMFIMLSLSIFLILLSIVCSGRGIYLMRKKEPFKKMFQMAMVLFVLAILCYFVPMGQLIMASM